jgi:hypothetical protein
MTDFEHLSWMAAAFISILVLLLLICPPLYTKYRDWKTRRAFRMRSAMWRKRPSSKRHSGK